MGDQSHSIFGKLIEGMKKEAHRIVGDVVTVEHRWPKDIYRDTHGNSLTDAPLNYDSAICRNNAHPTAQQIAQALRDLQRQNPISDSSNAYSFEGLNPIARMCASAPKTRY